MHHRLRRHGPAAGTVPIALAALAAAATALAAPRDARGQAEAWDAELASAVSGTWTLAISEAEARRAVEAGITAAVADLPALVDAIAARELRARIAISRRITLAVDASSIDARFAHASFRTAPGMPTRVGVPGDPSASMEVVQLLRGGRLEQIFTTDRGRRWSTFTPSEGATRLTLESVIRSERLPTDVRFSLPYRRAG